jgi:beta-lactamase regulating signal transducer with metallopeptidase domain
MTAFQLDGLFPSRRLSKMNLYNFFNSYAGMYVTQAFCHSIIASVISDQALRAWNISDPDVRQRFRLIVVLLPVFSFPLYQAFHPSRGSLQFRLEALFDSSRWMHLEIWVVPAGAFFLALLAITSLIFVFQEMLPIVLNTWQSKGVEQEGRLREPDPFIESSAQALSITAPDIIVLDDEDLVIYSATGRKPAIFVSEGLLNTLAPDELRAALAHELGHIARSRRPVLVLVFVFRAIMFFNPVSLVEFRRTVRNEEKICDDIAVSLTSRPEALAAALKHFFPQPAPVEATAAGKDLIKAAPLEDFSHKMQLESRIERLKAVSSAKRGGHGILLSAVILIIMVINYFVV